MPELPEVERARRLAEAVAVGRTIERAWCDRDDIVFDGVAPSTVARRLKGRRVVAAHRRGKQMWLEFDRGSALLLHLGMTGHVRAWRDGAMVDDGVVYEGGRPIDATEWPPRFTKLRLFLDDGGELVMTNARRLGRIRMRERPLEEPPISKLGFDPLHDLPAAGEFTAQLRTRKAPVKAVLMDQSFAAGVGNWIADEVLYQAAIDPRRKASELTDAEAKRVRTALAKVIAKAVEVNADKRGFPRTWLFHHRWGKNADAITARGEKIEHVTIGGRTTAWVPERQR